MVNRSSLKPVDNELHMKYGEFEIQYIDVHELEQGGPESEKLKINGETIEGYRYGTNQTLYNGFLIASVCKWSWAYLKREILNRVKSI